MRTVSNISQILHPLEEAIKNIFIPALVSQNITVDERSLISLPPRLGGLGIVNPQEMCDAEYTNSKMLSEQLTNFIITQNVDGEIDKEKLNKSKQEIRLKRRAHQENLLENLKAKMEPDKLRLLEASLEKGASNWLSCLPLTEYGFNLNKQEFRDSLKLRYGWKLDNLPTTCPCGNDFSVSHAMSCKLGGFIHTRHNEVRDLTAGLLREVCVDVSTEPALQPIGTRRLKYRTANRADDARLDVSARNFWQRVQRVFADVRVFHPSAPRLLSSSLQQLHKNHEQEKRRCYNERIIQVEQGTFTPLVFTTSGGMSRECSRFYSRLAHLISEKRGESYSNTTTWLRCRLSFSLLRSAILCMRGTRATHHHNSTDSTTFDLARIEANIK